MNFNDNRFPPIQKKGAVCFFRPEKNHRIIIYKSQREIFDIERTNERNGETPEFLMDQLPRLLIIQLVQIV